ncbi:hypothetical protein AXE83_06705 [Streptococcus sp. oral taxon 431]|uniref:hypothetical protein n=1 Tax=Streptococcus sp. oral taxon 431 TaxID=712633 RepID=UPI0007683F04|nr:hypothetical protein [Streptococcus sp. oral taxon 431]AMD97299.1 hypothetical protein AXE83_06705 [Streptococcus sp. oral taxon 431]
MEFKGFKIKFIWDSILRHPVISSVSFIITTSISVFGFWVSVVEIQDKLGDKYFWQYTAYIVLSSVLVSLFLYIWSKIANYLFYNDYTSAVSEYMANASKHDVWHLSKATKEYRRIIAPENGATERYRKKILDNGYKSFTTLTKHTFGDIFSDLEKVLSKSLYTKLKITLQLFPADFDMGRLNDIKGISELQYSDYFVEDGRMNLRDSVKKPLTEDMKKLMFSKNLTHIYTIKEENKGILFILTAKSFSEFPKIYGFIDFSWGELSRPFMDKDFLIDFIIPVMLERINVMCYYISSVESYMSTFPAIIYRNSTHKLENFSNFNFLAILYQKYNE